MFRTYVGMVQSLRLFACEGQYLLDAGRVRNIPNHFGFGMGSHMLLDLHSYGLQVEPHFLQYVDRNTLAKFDQAEQKMFSSYVVMVEAIRFFASKRQHLL